MRLGVEAVFAILVLCSFFAFFVGYFEFFGGFFAVVLLFSTYIKGILIGDYFMNLKSVRWRYRIIPTLWLVMVLSLVSVAYLHPTIK